MSAIALGVPILSAGAHAQPVQRCVEARVGGEVAYDCLNEAWKQLAEQAHTPLAMNTLSVRSPATATGTFNRSATAERMGNTFGHSAFPQRPPAPVYANPLLAPAGPR